MLLRLATRRTPFGEVTAFNVLVAIKFVVAVGVPLLRRSDSVVSLMSAQLHLGICN
jgi:hypothetical protein